MFTSLRNRDYRRFFVGISIANLGVWMNHTALAWLVLVVLPNGRASNVGLLLAANFLPGLLLSPLAGAFADRYRKRMIILWSQVAMTLITALIAALIWTQHINLVTVLSLALLNGVAKTFDGPARSSMPAELVGLDKLANAISLGSASWNSARLLGPGIAGGLIALSDTAPVVMLGTATYAALILTMLSMPDPERPAVAKQRGQIRAGFRYVWQRSDLMLLLFVVFMMGSFAFNFAISNAVMATQLYGRGPGEYGILGSFLGIGALSAALLSARRARPRLRHMLIAIVCYVCFSTASALAPSFWLYAAWMTPLGLSAITAMITINALLQLTVAPEMRGRVMSLWQGLVVGGAPITAPAIGWIGDTFGPQWTILVPTAMILATLVIVMSILARGRQMRTRIRGFAIRRL